MLDEIEQELQLSTYAVNYPIGMGDLFQGVFDRRSRAFHLFERVTHGSKEAPEKIIPLSDPAIEQYLEQKLYYQVKEELEGLYANAIALLLEESRFATEVCPLGHAGQFVPVNSSTTAILLVGAVSTRFCAIVIVVSPIINTTKE